jgi:hypothetical protein
MSVDLTRLDDGEILTLSNQEWASILKLAAESGWVPEGTRRIDEDGNEVEDWDEKDYQSNDGQLVRGSDVEMLVNSIVKVRRDKLSEEGLQEAINNFIEFAKIAEDGDEYFPGFEIY